MDGSQTETEKAVAADMKVSLIIVSYNVSGYLRQCLKSVWQSSIKDQLEVIVVDNHSFDDSVRMVKKNFPQVKLIRNNSNIGFARAVNQAMRKANGKYLCILNPDAVVKDDTVQVMADYMEANPDVGVTGCKVLNPDGSFQLASRRTFPRPGVAVPRLLGLHILFPRNKLFSKYNLTHLDDDSIHEVDAVSGACMMFKKSLVSKIGGFDERFFMYFEDTDFCQRAKQAGYRVIYHPGTQIIHYKGESRKHAPIRSRDAFHKSTYLFYEKYSKEFRLWFLFKLILKAGIYFHRLTEFVSRYRSTMISSAADTILILLSFILAMAIWYPYNYGIPITFPFIVRHWELIFTYLMVWFIVSGWLSLYRKNHLSYGRSLVISTLTFIVTATVTYFISVFAYSRVVLLFTYIISSFLMSMWRIFVHILYRNRWVKVSQYPPLFTRRAIILGEQEAVHELTRRLSKTPTLYYEVKGYISETFPEHTDQALPYLGHLSDIEKIVRNAAVNEVIIMEEFYPVSRIIEQIQKLASQRVIFKFIPDGQHYLIGKGVIENIGGIPLVDIEFPLFDRLHLLTKRLFDMVLSFALIILTLPVQLFYLVTGRYNTIRIWTPEHNPIRLFEFRSSVPVIRKMPYLYSIFIGHLSFVGSQVVDYSEPDPHSLIKPGITGLYQLKQETVLNTNTEFEQYYIQNHNVIFDLEIILKSILRI